MTNTKIKPFLKANGIDVSRVKIRTVTDYYDIANRREFPMTFLIAGSQFSEVAKLLEKGLLPKCSENEKFCMDYNCNL